MAKKDLTKLFNKFAGQEIPMTETTRKCGPGIRGVYRELNPTDPNDPTLKEMEKTAKANGLKLRVLWPGLAGTMDYRPDRITANIEKGKDGKYRIANDFRIG